MNRTSGYNVETHFADFFRRQCESVGLSTQDMSAHKEPVERLSPRYRSSGGKARIEGHDRSHLSSPLIRPEIDTPPPETTPLSTGVRFVEMQDMDVASVRYIGPYQGIAEALRLLYRWASPRGLLEENSTVFGALHDVPGITHPDELRSDACIVVPADTLTKTPVFYKRLNTKGLYACAYHEFRDKREFPKHWYNLWANWLPRSGYHFDDRPMLEFYKGDPRMRDGVFRVDMCIPVKSV